MTLFRTSGGMAPVSNAAEFPYALWRDSVSDLPAYPTPAGVTCFHTPCGVTLFRTPPDRPIGPEVHHGFHTPCGVTLFRTIVGLWAKIHLGVSIRLVA